MSTGEDVLEQRQAEILGRQFNAALTNGVAYGPEHPQTERACTTLNDHLVELLESLDSITLLMDRGALFVEDFQADAKFNANRIMQTFRATGLQSLTFDSELTTNDLIGLMQQLTNAEELGDVEAFRAALEEAGLRGIRANHVVLKKLTAQDEVVEREGLAELTDLAEQASAGGARPREGIETGDLLQRIEKVFAMRNLIEPSEDLDPDDAAAAQRVAAQIRALGDQIGSGSELSLDVVLEAVETMKTELAGALEDQKETAAFLAEHGGIIDEVDELTYRTVVALVCEEYQAGKTSPRRLSQIIRRLLPDSRDIKRLLPMLKDALMADGMPLSTWLQFVNELTGELKSENLVQVLSEGAEQIGMGVDDILREIQQDPGEAARLIVLASELRRGDSDKDRLSAVLADHIEHATVELLPDATTGRVTRFNRDSIRKVQQELIDKVRNQGMDETTLRHVNELLDGRFEEMVDSARNKHVGSFLDAAPTMDPRDMIEALEKMVEKRGDLDKMDRSLRRALGDRGLDGEQVEHILDQARTRIRRRNRIEFVPGDALNPASIRYFLNREILSAVRYGTLFSGIMLMIAQVKHDEKWRAIKPAEIEAVMPRILDALPLHLRDLDLLGLLGDNNKNVPLIVLPMTPREGAELVLDRMLTGLGESTFELEEESVQLKVVGSAMQFDPEATGDINAFLQKLRGSLANQLVAALRSN